MADKEELGAADAVLAKDTLNKDVLSKGVPRVTIQPKTGNPSQGQMDRPSELEELRPQLATFTYPIANHDDLLKAIIPGHKYLFRGKPVDPKKSIPKIPESFFPIKSAADFEAKIQPKIKLRPSVPINPVLPVLKHPTSETVPRAEKKPA